MSRRVLFEHRTPTDRIIRIVQGDLTEEQVDAIVNAANEHLAHGGGVAGAIARHGGQVIQQESNHWVRTHGKVVTGSAAITSGGALLARHVIHAVGPVWGTGDETSKLNNAVRSALALAEEHDVGSISLPAISSGIFGFPKQLCAQVILEAVSTHLNENPHGSLTEVNLCNLDDLTAGIFDEEARHFFAS
jgi:O-acetyl-ADP-ribose deacetylase